MTVEFIILMLILTLTIVKNIMLGPGIPSRKAKSYIRTQRICMKNLRRDYIILKILYEDQLKRLRKLEKQYETIEKRCS